MKTLDIKVEWCRRWADGKRNPDDYNDLAIEVHKESNNDDVVATWCALTSRTVVSDKLEYIEFAKLVHEMIGRRVLSCFNVEIPITDRTRILRGR